jgi:hypothetical protein
MRTYESVSFVYIYVVYRMYMLCMLLQVGIGIGRYGSLREPGQQFNHANQTVAISLPGVLWKARMYIYLDLVKDNTRMD